MGEDKGKGRRRMKEGGWPVPRIAASKRLFSNRPFYGSEND